MGRIDTRDFSTLIAQLGRRDGVAECLPYPGMTPIPYGFDTFARQDAARSGFEWDDVCPAYALALISKGSYTLPADEDDMQVLWDELGGNSTQLWEHVRPVVMSGWAWLDRHPLSLEEQAAPAAGGSALH